jgi:hypothetical protein
MAYGETIDEVFPSLISIVSDSTLFTTLFSFVPFEVSILSIELKRKAF